MEQFLLEIEAYAKATGLKPSTIVQRGGGASGIAWEKWKAGGSCSMRTADRIREFIKANPPKIEREEPAQ